MDSEQHSRPATETTRIVTKHLKETAVSLFNRKQNNEPEYLKLSEFEKELNKEFLTLEPGEPFYPWNNRVIISAAGIYASGWTMDNKVFLLSSDGYSITNPQTGVQELWNHDINDEARYKISSDNLEFSIQELNHKIKIFGLRGGDGNHVCNDGWVLQKFTPSIGREIIGIRKPYDRLKGNAKYLEDLRLINLVRLEYFNLKMGFSPNEKYFGIFGSGGAEVFSKE